MRLTRPSGQGRRLPPGTASGAPAAAGSLRAAITAGIHDVYLGLALAAVGTLVVVLVLVPPRFATMPGATASAGPADRAALQRGKPG